MKHKVFTRSMRILIVGTLIIMALGLSAWIQIGFTAGWLIFMTVYLIVKSEKARSITDEPTEEQPAEDSHEPEDITDEPEDTPSENEAETWYQMIGKTILTDAITDLNTRGYKQLSINENGNILISGVVCDTVDSFPELSLWNRLTELMKEDGLNAFVAGNEISVSW